VGNSDEQLLSILATLEECRAALRRAGKDDTAQMLSVAVLDLRMKLSHISDTELRAMCEQMVADERASDGSSPRRRPLLRLVK
jgi:hypothetical protein